MLSVIVLLIVAAGIFAFERGWFHTGVQQTATSAAGASAGGQGGAGRWPGGAGGAAQAAPVVTAKVTTDDTGLDVTTIGTVAAAQEVTLYPEVTGFVTEVDFKAGDTVQKGQTLVKLDDKSQQVAVQIAQLALQSAQSASDRADALAKTNNITSQALEDAHNALEKAQADLKSAQLDVSQRVITAPFTGTIGLTDLSVGDLVTSSKAISTLDDMSTVTVSFSVPERASGLVQAGQAINGTADALPGTKFPGKVTAIDTRVDPVARTLNVQATLPNDSKTLKPGMALDVAMTFAGEPRPAVPSLAVQWDRNGSYVWRVAQDDTAHRVAITIVSRISGTVIVAGDLKVGDEVVTDGLQRMREGIKVVRTDASGNPITPAATT
ncbi:MAG TPA: efflux RND transporter periplasmic adaptor subunit [Bauldia sp.]|nr:efflux RND transporter periplasmic adaptor subunit [Bauldia sp.]